MIANHRRVLDERPCGDCRFLPNVINLGKMKGEFEDFGW
jgi:hypothetical protein